MDVDSVRWLWELSSLLENPAGRKLKFYGKLKFYEKFQEFLIFFRALDGRKKSWWEKVFKRSNSKDFPK